MASFDDTYLKDSDIKRQFTALNIQSSYQDDDQYKIYDGFKSRKTTWWRWWKQRSRFQRTMIYMAALLIVVSLILFAPSLNGGRSKTLLPESSRPVPVNRDARKNEEATQAVQIEMPHDEEPVEEKQKLKSVGEAPDEDNEIDSIIMNGKIRPPDPPGIIFRGPENERQMQVVEAFKHAWKGYKEHAWGHDHLKPISKSYHDWFGLGLTIVDSLDTMYIMNLEEEFREARTFVAERLDLAVNKDVNLFETTIRILGGLLGAYHLSKDELFLKKAVEMGDLLLPAFNSISGIPYSDINLYSHHAHAPRWGPDSSVSEVSTVQLEFKDLSRLTGEEKYEKAADRVSEVLHALPKMDGLVPIYINAETGKFRPSATITLGARGDSYYEYLLKQWLQTGKTRDFLVNDYNASVSGIFKHLVKTSEPNKFVFVGELTNGKNFRPKMDHLVCYLPSVLALGTHNGLPKTHLKLAESLIYTCYQMYAQMPTFLSPEIAHFSMGASTDPDIFVKVNDAHNLLRPETVESLWYLYQLTGNATYREWGWQIFQAFEKYSKVKDGGYTTIDNVKSVDDTRPRDMMESFFLSETLKYFYLLFGDDQTTLSLDKYVFNSEAHPLPINDS